MIVPPYLSGPSHVSSSPQPVRQLQRPLHPQRAAGLPSDSLVAERASLATARRPGATAGQAVVAVQISGTRPGPSSSPGQDALKTVAREAAARLPARTVAAVGAATATSRLSLRLQSLAMGCSGRGCPAGRRQHSLTASYNGQGSSHSALAAAAMPGPLVDDAALNDSPHAAVTASDGGRRKQQRSGVSAAAPPPANEKSRLLLLLVGVASLP